MRGIQIQPSYYSTASVAFEVHTSVYGPALEKPCKSLQGSVKLILRLAMSTACGPFPSSPPEPCLPLLSSRARRPFSHPVWVSPSRLLLEEMSSEENVEAAFGVDCTIAHFEALPAGAGCVC